MSVIDPKFRIAAPPVELALTAWDHKLASRLTVICCVIIALAALFAVREWSRTGTPLLLLLIAGHSDDRRGGPCAVTTDWPQLFNR